MNIIFESLASVVLILGLFFLAYLIDHENKEYCVAGGGVVSVYDRDIIYDDWVCQK